MARLDDDLLDAIDLFSAAAMDGTLWLPALRRLADLTGSSHGQLLGVGHQRNVPFNLLTELPDSITDAFVAINGASAYVNPRIAASDQARLLQLVTEEDIQRCEARLLNTDYLDFAHTFDIPFGCQSAVMRDDEGLVGLAVLRTAREGPTSEAQRQVFQSLAPFVRMAVQTQMALNRQTVSAMAGAFEAMAVGAFLCDHDGRVLTRTTLSDAVLESQALRLTRGRLRTFHPADEDALQAAITRLATRRSSAQPAFDTIVLRKGGHGDPVVLDMVPLPRSMDGWARTAPVLIIVRGSAPDSRNRAAILMAAFDLTRSEAKIAALLLDGHSRRYIALQRGVSEATVHTQMKSIFVKCGISRETELVAKLLRIISG